MSMKDWLPRDTSGNLNTNANTLGYGEDAQNDLLKTEQRYSPFNISVNGTISIIKPSSGFLHNINIGMFSNPTITIFDNASGASGTVLFHAQPQGLGGTGSYTINLVASSGITAYTTAGNGTIITGGYR